MRVVIRSNFVLGTTALRRAWILQPIAVEIQVHSSLSMDQNAWNAASGARQ